MLDAICPNEVLRNLSNAQAYFVAGKKGDINADSVSVYLNEKYDFKDIKRADILLISGSFITFIREMKNKNVLQWIQNIEKTTKWTTSVCSSSFIVVATGLLKNKVATSYWKTIALFKQYKARPKQKKIAQQCKYITAADMYSTIDRYGTVFIK